MASLNNLSKYRNFSILRPDLITLFWSKIDKSGSTPESQAAMLAGRVKTPCHLWVGRLDRDGYGQVDWYSKSVGSYHCCVYILAYYLINNDLPQERGLELDHLCRVRHCCNPEHLEPVTNIEHQRRTHCSISIQRVFLIRYLRFSCFGWTYNKIAKLIGTSTQNVHLIASGKRRR